MARLVQNVTPICLHWPLTKLFPPAWVGSLGQSLLYLYRFLWHFATFL